MRVRLGIGVTAAHTHTRCGRRQRRQRGTSCTWGLPGAEDEGVADDHDAVAVGPSFMRVTPVGWSTFGISHIPRPYRTRPRTAITRAGSTNGPVGRPNREYTSSRIASWRAGGWATNHPPAGPIPKANGLHRSSKSV